MTMILGGTNPAVTFPDSSVQNTSAIVGGYVPYANLPAGSVLQTVSTTYATQDTVASTSYTDTGLLLAITPKFSTSKILVIISAALRTSRSTNDFTAAGMQITRAGTGVFSSGNALAVAAGTGAGNDIAVHAQCSLVYLDSPATTSSTTYRLQIKNSTTANSASTILNNSSTSTITLMEIAA